MSTRTKQALFFVAYVYVLFQMFAMLVVTLAVFQLGAPSAVKTAAVYASFFVGMATVVVMILRPKLERDLIGQGKSEN